MMIILSGESEQYLVNNVNPIMTITFKLLKVVCPCAMEWKIIFYFNVSEISFTSKENRY